MKILKSTLIILLLAVKIAMAADTIYVSHDKFSTIQFGSDILKVNELNSSLIFEVQDKRVIMLKTKSADFKPVEISITTANGEHHIYHASFSYGRAGRNLIAKTETVNESKIIRNTELKIKKIAESKRLRAIGNVLVDKVKTQLDRIYIAEDSLFYKICLTNRSNINYDIDFIRFYVRDLKTAKRTVTQEQEIYPVASYGLDNRKISAGQSLNYVFAIKKFPVSKNQAFFIEIYEKNGSRHLYLRVKQKHILKAKAINQFFNLNQFIL